MKKIIALSAVLCLMITISANAQKLPNVQEKNLRAPATIKVDGKATEWNNQLKAYNKATEIFYTISNDNDKLYLAVQATDLDIINKIICRGITLTINGTGKMKDQEGIAITFPVLKESAFGYDSRGTGYMAPPVNLDKPDSWSADSFMVVLNKDFASVAKDIRVTGVKEITNSLISIYNPEGIKVMALFDNKTIFTYELAIPLKQLGLSVKDPKPLVYNIKLPGMNPNMSVDGQPGAAGRVQRNELRNGINDYGKKDGLWYLGGPTAARMLSLFFPTDFWAVYSLAK